RHNLKVNRAGHRKQIETWMAKHVQSGKLIGGESFETEEVLPVTVRRNSVGDVSVREGAFSGEAETLGGYVLVDVANREEAVELAKTWPVPETIEVRPLWKPGSLHS
ncbi:MAG: YciI family protein, partial [Candidatus Dormibacteraceae bacterium]